MRQRGLSRASLPLASAGGGQSWECICRPRTREDSPGALSETRGQRQRTGGLDAGECLSGKVRGTSEATLFPGTSAENQTSVK